MNIAVGFACLVAMVVTAGVTGLPEQQLAVGEQLDDYDGRPAGNRQRNKFCRNDLGGKCVRRNMECPEHLPLQKLPAGQPYCSSRRRRCCYPGCVFGDKVYSNGAMLQDACMELQCIEGVWNYTGSIVNGYIGGHWNYTGSIVKGCKDCNVWGDPHIRPYEPHNLNNVGDHIHVYDDYDTGLFVISQSGLPFSALFSVYADFEPCIKKGMTCVSKVFYSEPGVVVELVLPEELFGAYCQTAALTDPKCLTKILVNKIQRTIDDNGHVSSFFGILIFKASCDFWSCHIFIVGTKGFTVSLDVLLTTNYYLDIFAMPSLRGQLYGLCDVFTGAPTRSYTLQDGTQIYDFDDLKLFTESWRKPGTGRTTFNKVKTGRRSSTLQVNERSMNETMINEFGKQCEDIIEGVCKVIPAEKCEAFKDTCVLDMSRTGVRDIFVEGFLEYINDYSLQYQHS